MSGTPAESAANLIDARDPEVAAKGLPRSSFDCRSCQRLYPSLNSLTSLGTEDVRPIETRHLVSIEQMNC